MLRPEPALRDGTGSATVGRGPVPDRKRGLVSGWLPGWRGDWQGYTPGFRTRPGFPQDLRSPALAWPATVTPAAATGHSAGGAKSSSSFEYVALGNGLTARERKNPFSLAARTTGMLVSPTFRVT